MDLSHFPASRSAARFLIAALLTAAALGAHAQSQTPLTQPSLTGEIPAHLEPTTGAFDYLRRDVMIAMRDGVRLHTVILVPKGAKNAPMLLTRTPYDADAQTRHQESSQLGPTLEGYDNPTDVVVADGYIRVVQDVRGKYGSEGDYVMTRPLRGPLNPTPVDHSTDTYDTVDWLVRNVPETNGKVGILGISYDGFTSAMALVHPHPALKVAVPMNPMVDGWMGDDWFHYGAFREQNMPYIYQQEAARGSGAKWWTGHLDDYDEFMDAVSAGALGHSHGLEQVGFWRKLVEHPAYDEFWQEQALDKLLAKEPLKIPLMLVHSFWDQEDIYGAPAIYQALKPKDTAGDKVFLVLGPWHHAQEIGQGESLGDLKFSSDTALFFREHILRPFLAQYLKDGAPKADIAPVMAFETGTNRWQRLASWPAGCAANCSLAPTPVYLASAGRLTFSKPESGEPEFDTYVSDPAKPVPFRARPIQAIGYDPNHTWSRWLVDDQREASGREDVLVFTSEVLDAPIKISGQPIANLVAATSGTDSDWVVKLIDRYPDQVAAQAEMGGYQLMVAADIFRGRYRESLQRPKAITPNQPLLYRFQLPNANHVFLTGHRIMVQVQSSWFPLYDRNPQTFVPNIFWAKPGDYQKATERVYHSPPQASFVELPLVKGE
ncbi:MAG: CocE/NonD family hydrolase [Acidobacteria bacterium]|nr:CocE/NonD family hydrolase [Acidobacteriota bacterium]